MISPAVLLQPVLTTSVICTNMITNIHFELYICTKILRSRKRNKTKTKTQIRECNGPAALPVDARALYYHLNFIGYLCRVSTRKVNISYCRVDGTPLAALFPRQKRTPRRYLLKFGEDGHSTPAATQGNTFVYGSRQRCRLEPFILIICHGIVNSIATSHAHQRTQCNPPHKHTHTYASAPKTRYNSAGGHLLVCDNTTIFTVQYTKKHCSVFPSLSQCIIQHPGGQSLAASSSLYNRATERKARMSPALTMFPAHEGPSGYNSECGVAVITGYDSPGSVPFGSAQAVDAKGKS